MAFTEVFVINSKFTNQIKTLRSSTSLLQHFKSNKELVASIYFYCYIPFYELRFSIWTLILLWTYVCSTAVPTYNCLVRCRKCTDVRSAKPEENSKVLLANIRNDLKCSNLWFTCTAYYAILDRVRKILHVQPGKC